MYGGSALTRTTRSHSQHAERQRRGGQHKAEHAVAHAAAPALACIARPSASDATRQWPAYSAEVRKPASREGASIASSANTRPGPRRHHHHALREIDRLEHRMGDEHHRHAQLAPQRDQIVVELEPRDLVERRKRLVHQQHARRGDQRARDRDPHPHAAGELARIGVGEFAKADARKRLHDARRGFVLADAGEFQRQIDVGEHRRPRHQRRLLEHEADVLDAALTRAMPRHGAARRLAQARDDAQRRRFAAARRPEQRKELAVTHVEIEIVERDNAAAEHLADAAQRDDGSRRNRHLLLSTSAIRLRCRTRPSA